MAESGSTSAQPRLRDVITNLRPQVTFLWGVVAGVVAAVIAVGALFFTGVFTVNTAGLVSLDSQKVALRIQVELEESGTTTEVACPETIVAPIGFAFVCMVQTPGGAVSQAEVTITNVLGDINWYLRSELPQDG
jgi:hypothetical protein